MGQVEQSPARAAFSIAGTFAVIFGLVFLFYLFSTIMMVGGDGSAPGVTYLTLAIMQFSVKVLHTPDVSGVVSAVWLFSTIIFVIVFLSTLPYYAANPATNVSANTYGGYVFLAAFILGIWNLYNVTAKEDYRFKEKEIVLGVVSADPGVTQKVGIIDAVHVATWSESGGVIGRYEVYVRGKRDKNFQELYAVVDVSETSGKAKYTVRCTNSKIGYFKPNENPCKGEFELEKALLENPGKESSILSQRAAQTNDSMVQIGIAESTFAAQDLLETLSRSTDSGVVLSVTNNKNTDSKILEWIYKNHNSHLGVLAALSRHPNTPEFILRGLYDKRTLHGTIAWGLARNTSLPDDILTKLTYAQNKNVLREILNRPNLSCVHVNNVVSTTNTIMDDSLTGLMDTAMRRMENCQKETDKKMPIAAQ